MRVFRILNSNWSGFKKKPSDGAAAEPLAAGLPTVGRRRCAEAGKRAGHRRVGSGRPHQARRQALAQQRPLQFRTSSPRQKQNFRNVLVLCNLRHTKR